MPANGRFARNAGRIIWQMPCRRRHRRVTYKVTDFVVLRNDKKPLQVPRWGRFEGSIGISRRMCDRPGPVILATPEAHPLWGLERLHCPPRCKSVEGNSVARTAAWCEYRDWFIIVGLYTVCTVSISHVSRLIRQYPQGTKPTRKIISEPNMAPTGAGSSHESLQIDLKFEFGLIYYADSTAGRSR